MELACKMVLLGIDGATWNVMQPLMSEGKLPHLSYLMRNGCRGRLVSLDPTFTPIVWTSIATGKDPNVHGIRHFRQSRQDMRTLAIWDILEDYGASIGVFNWHVTAPARPTRGFMFPGGFAIPSEETYPRSLAFLLKLRKMVERQNEPLQLWTKENLTLAISAIRHGLKPGALMEAIRYVARQRHADSPEILEAWKSSLGQQILTDIYVNTYRKFMPFFSAFYMGAIDVAAHMAWKYYEPQRFVACRNQLLGKYRDMVPMSYVLTDRCIGKILAMLGDDTAVIVVSDHGTKAAVVGRITLAVRADTVFQKIGMTERIDYFVLDHKSYFSAREGQTGAENETRRRLESVTICDTGQRVFSVTECEVKGLYCVESIDQGLGESLGTTYVNVCDKRVQLSEIVEVNNFRVSGIHDRYGVFLAYGPGIRRGIDLGDIEVTDIVPTILYYENMPVGRDMPGKCVLSMFEEGLNKSRQIRYVESYDTNERLCKYLSTRSPVTEYMQSEDDARVTERLRTLGYV